MIHIDLTTITGTREIRRQAEARQSIVFSAECATRRVRVAMQADGTLHVITYRKLGSAWVGEAANNDGPTRSEIEAKEKGRLALLEIGKAEALAALAYKAAPRAAAPRTPTQESHAGQGHAGRKTEGRADPEGQAEHHAGEVHG